MSIESTRQQECKMVPSINFILLIRLLPILTLLELYKCEYHLRADNELTPAPLWLFQGHHQTNQSDRMKMLFDRVGPNMRASSNYHDFEDQTIDDSLVAWKGMESQSREYARTQINYYEIILDQLLIESNVSLACFESTKITLQALKDLRSWAVQMWDSMGNFPPPGLFGGEFTDLGSYGGCMDISVPDNRINYSSYCTLAFRPILASRKPFHMFSQKEHKDLLNLFDKDSIFNMLAHKSQYFHYIYMKTGICVPGQCKPEDVQRVAKIIGRRWYLSSGPVKCFVNSPMKEELNNRDNDRLDLSFGKIENEPVLVDINQRMNLVQVISVTLIAAFYLVVFLSTIWHLSYIYETDSKQRCYKLSSIKPIEQPIEIKGSLKYIAFNYFSIITNGQEFLDTSWKSNEITCLHGLRVLTMIWIIIVHCLQYNEWSGFTRVFQIEATLQNPLLHPIYNANYVVDNFFFMSGLLATYSTWNLSKEIGSHTVRVASNIVNRYLRLTPQVMLVSMCYMLLPIIGQGPFWYDMTEQASQWCQKNWWINLLHLQAFYREDEICNLVSWWISVDMFYYITALLITYLVLTNNLKSAIVTTIIWVASCSIISATKHYYSGYPPNNLGTIPQAAEVWTGYVVNFFWSPFTHAFPFYIGLWVGYILANNKYRHQVQANSGFGHVAAVIALITINMSSHVWMAGYMDIGSQWISTIYNCLCPLIWVSALAWIVIACHYDCMPTLNKILSNKIFVLLSKASFIIYLSHMLEVRLYFGTRVALVEVSYISLCYIIVGNIFLSTIFGLFLCITFEGPSMKFQKLVAGKIKSMNKEKAEVKTQAVAMINRKLNVAKNS